MEPILQLKNLTKVFPAQKNFFGRVVKTVKAVSDVSLDVFEGEVVGLVGESGCGKSTLGRLILKLLEPTSGQILYRGQNITAYSTRQMRPLRKEMQIVFQDPYSSLNPRMTVGRTLAEPLKLHGLVSREKRTERLLELLHLVGLDESALDKYPHEFSGGQRQRIGIARALAVNPKVLIADEAVSALDISIQAQIINLLMDLKRRLNLTLIFIGHDLKVIEHLCDRVVVMYLGRIMEILPAVSLRQARHPYTRSLLSAIPVPDPDMVLDRQILKGDVPSPIDPPTGCVFHTRCPIAEERCQKTVPLLTPQTGEFRSSCLVVGEQG